MTKSGIEYIKIYPDIIGFQNLLGHEEDSCRSVVTLKLFGHNGRKNMPRTNE